MSDLSQPFRYQRERLEQVVAEAEELRRGLRDEIEAMPDLREECERRVFPLFRHWSADLRRAIQPITKIRDLRRRARSLRTLMGLVLRNGPAVRTLLSNALLRLAILLVFLLKLGLVALIIWGAIRLADWLSQVF